MNAVSLAFHDSEYITKMDCKDHAIYFPTDAWVTRHEGDVNYLQGLSGVEPIDALQLQHPLWHVKVRLACTTSVEPCSNRVCSTARTGQGCVCIVERGAWLSLNL